jgi:hypothetical protein
MPPVLCLAVHRSSGVLISGRLISFLTCPQLLSRLQPLT